MLLGCYRQGEAADPEVYVAAVAAVLAHYDEDIVRDVTDPVKGLPGVLKWLPTVAEIRQACEERLRPARETEARAKREAETRLILEGPTASPEERERAVEKWEREKAFMAGKLSAEEARIEAEKRLPELYREVRSSPLPTLSDAAKRRLFAENASGDNP